RGPEDASDPTLASDAAGLISFLLQDLLEGFPKEARGAVEGWLREMLRVCVRRMALGSQGQIGGLGRAGRGTTDFVTSLRLGDGRVFVLELPVGNSLPAKLLVGALTRRGAEPTVVRASLSRSDAAKHGKTRKEMLLEGLAERGLKANDLVIYMDEWFTGSN